MVNSSSMICAYLGDEFSYSYKAAIKSGLTGLRGYPTITAALNSVKEGAAEMAIVPIENSVEGSVTETLDALNKLSLYITGEITIPISHSLIVLSGADINNIDTVYGHSQALSQCRENLANLMPKANYISAMSTSDALKKIKSEREAAVGGACLVGQAEAVKGIEDYKNNATRFVIVKKNFLRDGEKVSIVFHTHDEPGALYKALGLVYSKNLNMTKIESRPSKSALGKYVFFIDFNFSGSFTQLNAVFSDLQSGGVTELKFLGFYK